MWLLVTASMQAQQSIGDAMRHAAVVSSPMPAEGLLAPPDSVEAALHSLYQRAEVVFTGEVTLIERKGDAVAVSFRVDDGIRNVVSGSTYVLREWSGLWADDASRYVVGERRLMLLHANSVCGFASPAGGFGYCKYRDGGIATGQRNGYGTGVCLGECACCADSDWCFGSGSACVCG
jgi:hypothetical protein